MTPLLSFILSFVQHELSGIFAASLMKEFVCDCEAKAHLKGLIKTLLKQAH